MADRPMSRCTFIQSLTHVRRPGPVRFSSILHRAGHQSGGKLAAGRRGSLAGVQQTRSEFMLGVIEVAAPSSRPFCRSVRGGSCRSGAAAADDSAMECIQWRWRLR